MGEEYIKRVSVTYLISHCRKHLDKTNPHFLVVDNALLNVQQLFDLLEERKVLDGRWIGYPDYLALDGPWGDDYIVCSVCGEAFDVLDNDTHRFRYCPNCGAKMEGEIK